MKYYVISIGGTGSRQAEMLVHLAAAGLIPDCDHLRIYYVDADAQNGDTNRMIETVSAYTRMRACVLTDQEAVFRKNCGFLPPEIEAVSWGIDKAIGQLNSTITNPTYAQLAAKEGDVLAQDTMNLLHPSFDQNVKLEHGFYGDPSMGASIFRAAAQTDAFVGNVMFEEFKSELTALGGEVRVVLTGSVFGGTGASLFPNMAKKIREKLPKTTNLFIGGALMLPYFTFPNPPGATVTCTDFHSKTAAALDYYDSRANLVRDTTLPDKSFDFDALWLCGFDQKEQTSDVNVAGGQSQIHRMHFAELLSGIISCAFLADPAMSEYSAPHGGKQIYTYQLDPSREALDWTQIAPIYKTRLAALARFSMMMLTVIRAELEDNDALNNHLFKRLFGKVGFRGPADCDLDKLRQQESDTRSYFISFLSAMNEIQSSTSVDLFNAAAFRQVLNMVDKPKLTLDDAQKIGYKVLSNDDNNLTMNDFTGTWQRFRPANAGDDEAKMRQLFAELYSICMQ